MSNANFGIIAVLGTLCLAGCAMEEESLDQDRQAAERGDTIEILRPGKAAEAEYGGMACEVDANCATYSVRSAADAIGFECALDNLAADEPVAIQVIDVNAQREKVLWQIVSGNHGLAQVRAITQTRDDFGETYFYESVQICEVLDASVFASCRDDDPMACASPSEWFGECRTVAEACNLIPMDLRSEG